MDGVSSLSMLGHKMGIESIKAEGQMALSLVAQAKETAQQAPAPQKSAPPPGMGSRVDVSA